jgi:hypothetical protein
VAFMRGLENLVEQLVAAVGFILAQGRGGRDGGEDSGRALLGDASGRPVSVSSIAHSLFASMPHGPKSVIVPAV